MLGLDRRINCVLIILVQLFILESCGEASSRQQLNAATTFADTISFENDSLKKVRSTINANQKARQLDSLFRKMAKHHLLNGDVLIAQYGQIIYKNSFGYRRRKPDDTLTLNSAFQMGSSTKPITATAILMLKEKGKLNLSQTVDEFFPDFPYKKITIKSLLTHRTGLPNYMYFCDPLYQCKEEPMSNAELLKIMIEKHPPRYSAPNRRFQYCNTNYALLASIIEKVSGKSYAQFLTDEIFIPLGMTHTWVSNIPTDSLNPNKTIGYETNWKKYDVDYLDGVLGDKNIFTTVDDLFLFDQAMYTEKLLSKATIREAYRGDSRKHFDNHNYGYGWRLRGDRKGVQVAYHNGWWHGYNNVFWRRLKDKTTIIILSNKINRGIYQVENILQILDESGSEPAAFREEYP